VQLKAFTDLLKYLRSVGDFKENVEDEVLDISLKDDVRVSIVGMSAIQSYCKSQHIADESSTTVMFKKKINDTSSLFFERANFKIDLRNEMMVDGTKRVDLIKSAASSDTTKGFRLKKRFTYTDATNTYRVDMTIVRQAYGFKTFTESEVGTKYPTYEIEVEMIKRSIKSTKTFLQGILEVYTVLLGEEHLLSTDEKKIVLQNYLNLVFGNSKGKKAMMEASQRPKQYFAGPQPITLERKNIIDMDLGVTTIQNEYTVTEKADGERMLFFVNNTGRCYLINNRLDIKYTGVKLHSIVNTLIDGEFVHSKKVFAVFDIYWDNGTDVRSQPLIPNRYQRMRDIVKKMDDKLKNIGWTLHQKEFRYGDNIFKEAEFIMEKATQGRYLYAIDGLIFTPKNLPVGGSFVNDHPESTGTWNKVFKWKPPHDNTIDFMVIYKSDQDFTVMNGKTYKVLSLYVGYNPAQWESISARQYIEGNVVRTGSYIAKEFIPGDVMNVNFSKSYIEVTSVKDKITCLNGDEIESNSVVEFSFDAETMRWNPLRVREDKTEMLRRFGLSGTANDYGTAMNIWKSIRYPVMNNMIVGKEKISQKDVVEDDVYYYRVTSRDKFASRPMLDFHNYWIKGQTLFAKLNGMSSLLDVSCGKGGDIPKWIDNGFSKVLGVDVSRDNIENPVDGAYARTLQNKKYNSAQHTFLYVTLDSSKKFTKETLDELSNTDDRIVCKHLWGLQRMDTAKNASTFGFATDKFDVVSCQFSIHYFFENESKLDTLLWNVNQHLKSGGCFIGTCLDGHSVKKLLRHVPVGESVQGTKFDRVLWNIKKAYENDDSPGFGEEIEVFMESIGKVSREYLVNMDVLKEKLMAYDILLSSCDSFETAWHQLMSDTKDQDNVFTESIKKMSKEEQTYSFLNTWFVFKKKDSVKKKVVIKKKQI
jgi:mRNA (guanine-N7-)-methyltransferase